MAAGNRNPKGLRDLVEGSREDMSDMQTNLAKLKSLSEDDKTENALLRSRINEQSQLIMILKQRADEASITTQTLERINRELEDFRDNAQDEAQKLTRKNNMVEARFNDLAKNHAEMINIKDDYKRRNVELMNENAKLRADNSNLFSAAITERDQTIAELDGKLKGANEKYSTQEKRHRKLEEQFTLTEGNLKAEVRDLRYKVAESEERLKGALAKLNQQMNSKQSADVESQNRLAQLTKEKDDLLDLAMSRGKLIQEKQTENKKLQQRIEKMEKVVKDMQDKFERDAEAVNVNLQVRKLRTAVEDLEEKYGDSTKEFDAYKKHSANLLKKEKELNERLRHLVS